MLDFLFGKSYDANGFIKSVSKIYKKYNNHISGKTTLQSEPLREVYYDNFKKEIENYPNFSANNRQFIEFIRLSLFGLTGNEKAKIFLRKTNYKLSFYGKLHDVTPDNIYLMDKGLHNGIDGNISIDSVAALKYPKSFSNKAIKMKPNSAHGFEIIFDEKVYVDGGKKINSLYQIPANAIIYEINAAGWDKGWLDNTYFSGHIL